MLFVMVSKEKEISLCGLTIYPDISGPKPFVVQLRQTDRIISPVELLMKSMLKGTLHRNAHNSTVPASPEFPIAKQSKTIIIREPSPGADSPPSGKSPNSLEPSITFSVGITSEVQGQIKSRNLVLSEKRVSLLKGNTNLWSYPAEDLIGIYRKEEKIENSKGRPKFVIEVVHRHEFQADDPDHALRIQDALKALKLDQQHGKLRNLNSMDTLEVLSSASVKKKGSNSSKQLSVSSSNESCSYLSCQTEEIQRGLEESEISIKKVVDLSCFEILKVVGEGSFGKVMKVRRKDDGLILAMKMLDLKSYPLDPYEEKDILEGLDHPFIVKLHCWFVEDQKLYLCMDYAEQGDLYYHLRRAGMFSEGLACFYLAEIILALDHLHRKSIVYRDLKPENILLASDGHIKIGDLGLAKSGITSSGGFNAIGSKAQTFCGTPQYLAPEVLKGEDHGFAVDWWSAGIVLYEMLTGHVPFYSDNRNEMYQNAIKGEIYFPSHVSKEAQKFIRAILVRRPEDRLGSGHLGVFEIKNHSFFQEIRWKDLEQKLVLPPWSPSVLGDVPAFKYGLDSLINTIDSQISDESNSNGDSKKEIDILLDIKAKDSLNRLPKDLNNSDDSFGDMSGSISKLNYSDRISTDKDGSNFGTLDSLISDFERRGERTDRTLSSVLRSFANEEKE